MINDAIGVLQKLDHDELSSKPVASLYMVVEYTNGEMKKINLMPTAN